MELKEPPLWQNLLLENPWPLTAVLAVVAVGLFWHGLSRDDKRARRVAPALGLLAAGVWVAAMYVTTDRERLLERTETLVGTTEPPRDQAEMAELFDPEARVLGAQGELWLESGERLAAELKRACDRFDVQGHWLRIQGAEMLSANQGRTAFVVNTSVGGRPVRSEWLITWKRGADDMWRVWTVQWLELQGRDPPPGIVW